MLNFPSTAETDSSIFSVDEASISCTSGSGNDIKVSPILYLYYFQRGAKLSDLMYHVRDFVVFIRELQFV